MVRDFYIAVAVEAGREIIGFSRSKHAYDVLEGFAVGYKWAIRDLTEPEFSFYPNK